MQTDSLNNATVLVVDDRADNLFLIKTVINTYLPECTVLTAENAADGLSIASETPVDGILIDVQMPHMDGIEMCRLLKANPETAHIPAILMSGYTADATQKATGLDAGAYDFVNKPIDNTELMARVSAILRIKKAEDQLRQSAKRLAALADRRTRQLADSEQYYRSLLYSLHEDVLVIDGDYAITDMNNSFLTTVGRDAEDVLGKPCYEISHDFENPCDQYGLECPLKKVFATGLSCRCQHTYKDRNGATRHLDMLASPMKDKDGKVTHIVKAIRDVTDQKGLEAQLRQAQKMEAVGRLAGGIAHDFRNQLTVITGYAEWLLSQMDDDNKILPEITEILNAAKRSTDLTGHLLAFSRKEILDPQTVDPLELIINLTEPLKHMIGEDVILITSGADNLPSITIDPGQFQHMLMNLAVNARDAMPEGGELRIEVRSTELDGKSANRTPDAAPGKYVAIAVSDTGVGMNAETRQNAFDPFFTTKASGEGTGLGLSMAYGFVTQSGGYITIDSEPGKGTTFTIYLPISVEAAQETESDDPAETAETKGVCGTILMTEDDEQLRNMLVGILRKGGHAVIPAGNAKEALPIGEHYDGEIDLLITDVVMPEVSGVELARRLKTVRPEMSVLFISGYGDSELIQKGLAENNAKLMLKPFGTDELLETVNRILA